MQMLFLTVVLLALLSCSSGPAVHVFDRGYGDEQVSAIADSLQAAGYKALPNPIAVPASIRRNSIIYPVIVEDFRTIETLQHTLEQQGLGDFQLIHLGEGGHRYSTENIGVYLINPDATNSTRAAATAADNGGLQLSRLYYSNCSAYEADLSLFAGGSAILQSYSIDYSDNDEETRIYDGQWQQQDARLQLDFFDAGQILFEIREFRGRDDYGRFYGIDLHTAENSASLDSCDFRFLTYDPGQFP
jgi:hypothetical protein